MSTDNTMPRRHRREEKAEPKYLRLRNILNLIFMVGAVVGVIIYLFGNTIVGTVIILAAMVFKIAECCLRFIH